MKKLLVLMQSVFLATAAITPALVSHQGATAPVTEEKWVISNDIVDFTFDSGSDHISVMAPNLLKVLQNDPMKGDDWVLDYLGYTFINPAGEELHMGYGYGSKMVFDWDLILSDISWGLIDVSQVQINLSSQLHVNNNSIDVSINEVSPIEEQISSLGWWPWRTQEMMDAFLIKDIKFEYEFHFSNYQ